MTGRFGRAADITELECAERQVNDGPARHLAETVHLNRGVWGGGPHPLVCGVDLRLRGNSQIPAADQLGPGRFDKAGIPAPGFFAYLDGIFEIGCGVLILAGLLTRLATVPMIINMIGALLITKLPILWGAAALYSASSGGWDFIRESRVDLAMLCGSLFLFIVGAGAYSLDARLNRTIPTGTADVGSMRA